MELRYLSDIFYNKYIPQNKDFLFCTLKYFHRELGLE